MRLFTIYTQPWRCLFFLCSLFFCLTAKGQLTADFKADVVKGCAPVLVNFTDLSSGSPTSWFWDLGNGNTSSTQNPGTLYFNAGTYNIKLIVKNAAGVDSIVKNSFIVISNDPDVNFTANRVLGCSPLPVRFADKSNAGFGSIVKWEWDFGDGATSLVQSPVHTYSVDGDITVILKVTNSTGCSRVLRKPMFLHVNPTPKADFTSGSSVSCSPPALVTFNNTTTGDYSSSMWTFGDKSTSTDTDPTHTYIRAGNYPVKLLVTNQFGCADSITKPTVIGVVSPDFTRPDTVCEGASVHFNNTSFPATSSSEWRFGDGTSSTDISPVKIFSASGSFNVQLVNNFGACIDSITKSIYVRPSPPVDFSITSPPASCSVPVNVSFAASAGAATSYKWDFGDGATSPNSSPSHSYTSYGSYSVSLTVSENNGCVVTKTKPDFISVNEAQISSFNDLPFFGCAPHTQSFSANITSPEPVANYLWSFGDGNTSSQATPTHSYTAAGSYDVSLIITTQHGCKDTLIYPSAIVTGVKPSVAFTATPRVACAYEQVQFTDQSAGTVNNWFWQFGDNFTSYASNPMHAYRDTGFFKVTLIVGNYYCFDTIDVARYIYIKPPVARFDVAYNCDTPYVRHFTNRSLAAETFRWKFGDGTNSTSSDPDHTYPAPGTYNTSLHVTNNGCYDDVFYMVTIIDEKPDFTMDNNVTCRNTISTFTATNINPDNIGAYIWDFGDSTGKVTTNVPQITHTYILSGVYSPSLTIIDKLGCERVVQKPLIATVNGPTAAFTNPEGTCVNTKVAFLDKSKPYGGYQVNHWSIDYGDGTIDSSSSAPSFIHTYALPGSYNVTEVITDAFGCTDSLFKPDAIIITSPSAAFSIGDSIACDNLPIRFADSSSGLIVDYAWSFGDGKSSALPNPSHAYTAEGSYDISLAVKDEYGCTDTSTILNGVVIGNAKALFSLSDSIIKCPPGQISFQSNSEYSSDITWDFDDGSSSTIPNPSHYFLTARTYNIKLTVKGFGSCVDSSVRKVVVQGPDGSFTYSPLSKCAPAAVNFTAIANNSNRLIWDFGDGTTTPTLDLSVTHLYTTVQKYVPRLLLSDTSIDCTITLVGADTITVSGVNVFIKTSPMLFCDSAAVQFEDSSVVQSDKITSYLWHFGDGTTSVSPNPFHSYPRPGIYPVHLTVTTEGGCVDSSSGDPLKVIKSPDIQIGGSAEICVGQQAVFSAAMQPDTSLLRWHWTFNNGDTSSLQLPLPETYALTGIYKISALVVNSSGCQDTASTQLTVQALPVISAGKDSVICLGQSLLLTATGGQSYQWQSDATLSCIACDSTLAKPLLSSVSYIVEGTNAAGCRNTDTVMVTVVQPFNIVTSLRDTICKGESSSLSVTGTDKYTWSPANGLSSVNSPNPSAQPDTTTIYRVVGSDYRSCFTDTAFVPVIVYPVPVFNILIPNITIAAGNSVTVKTSSSPDIIKWKWTPATGLDCIACAMPVASPLNSTTYRAIAFNQGGCYAEDQVTINLFCTAGNLYVPNTFSPNHDGSNDVFFPRGKGISLVKRFQVYNRWGNLIFQKSNFSINDPQYGWDGTYDGQPANSDVYAYQIEVICSDGEAFSFKGDISLIR